MGMCCSTQGQDESNISDMQGLVNGHAYSLIAAREVKTKTAKILKMCKIRNPHGETEWTGSWGDNSDMWTRHPNVAKELEFVLVEDGSFWMSFHDFAKYFGCLSVNKRSMPLDGVHPDKIKAVAAAKRK